MILHCTGPKGEPGYQAEVDGQVSECFIYDPANPLSQILAGRELTRTHAAMEEARMAKGAPA